MEQRKDEAPAVVPSGIMIVREPGNLPAVRPKGLVAKLAWVMGEIDRVPKHGRNDHHKYDYATEADIADAVRRYLAAMGVLLVSTMEAVEQVRETRSGNNNPQWLMRLTIKHTFMDGETGECLELRHFAEGIDNQDKAIWKAFSGSVKYVLLKTFLIPTGDDPEATDGEGRDTSQPMPQAQGRGRQAQGQGRQQPQGQQRPPRQQGQPKDGSPAGEPSADKPAEAKQLGRIKYLLGKIDPDHKTDADYLAKANKWLASVKLSQVEKLEDLSQLTAARFVMALEKRGQKPATQAPANDQQAPAPQGQQNQGG